MFRHLLRTLGEERLVDVTILDCFWYHMYLNGSLKVMEWIKEKGIFSKTYTFVPIVDGPCMILLDSLIISEPLKAEPRIRRFVKDLYHTQGKMARSCSIGSIPLLLPKVPQQRDGEECGMTTTWFSYSEIDAFEHKIRNFADLSLNDPPVMPCENVELEDESDSTIKVNDVGMKKKGRGPTMCHDVHALEDGKKICVEWDAVGQPEGKGGKLLRTFFGTVSRNADKCFINVQSWDKMPQSCIEDVWQFIQRKYDIPNEDLYRSWVMKDLSFKWKFHKYDLQKKYLKHDKKGIQIKPPSRYHINDDMWREAVKVWTSSTFRKEKTGTNPDRADIFIITHTRKDGRPINEDCAIAIEKLKALKQTQPSTNSSNPVVAKDDAFSKMTGKKVKLLELENEQVAEGIAMSIDPNKIVMGRPIGHVLVDEAKRSLFSG
ncbi:hypothetical protein Taro_026327 [Colocasia esculenta]|uniref:Transposase n=1 Tax=Colocasia esculenta TaxID=4460 RepID=A0A843V5W5_COLES|nr:hypothetical protein [Colocasia esculenta]